MHVKNSRILRILMLFNGFFIIASMWGPAQFANTIYCGARSSKAVSRPLAWNGERYTAALTVVVLALLVYYFFGTYLGERPFRIVGSVCAIASLEGLFSSLSFVKLVRELLCYHVDMKEKCSAPTLAAPAWSVDDDESHTFLVWASTLS